MDMPDSRISTGRYAASWPPRPAGQAAPTRAPRRQQGLTNIGHHGAPRLLAQRVGYAGHTPPSGTGLPAWPPADVWLSAHAGAALASPPRAAPPAGPVGRRRRSRSLDARPECHRVQRDTHSALSALTGSPYHVGSWGAAAWGLPPGAALRYALRTRRRFQRLLGSCLEVSSLPWPR